MFHGTETETIRVVERGPEPQGAETFGRSRSWSRYAEVSVPNPGQTKVVFKNHNSYRIGASKWIK